MKCMTRTILATLAAALLSHGAKATTEEVGGMTYEYTIADGKATITKATGNNKVVSVPDTLGGAKVTTLGAGSFKDNTTVEQVVLPESVTTFEYDRAKGGVFERCDMLESINIPSGVTNIRGRCFCECTRLTKIELPSGLKAIYSEAFRDCWSLETINFPSKLEKIGTRAFDSCRKLANVDLPDSVTTLADGTDGNITPEGTFYGCKALEKIRLPKSLIKIPQKCFDGCGKLANISIPDSVTEIDHDAFSGCTSLAELVVPSSVTSVGGYAFSGVKKVIIHVRPNGQPPAGLSKSGHSLIAYVND